MRLSVIIIGDEILIGQVTDTNSGSIARTFGPAGWEIASVTTVGDNAADITAAVGRALDSSDLVITTGGLGPTKDDITKTVLMQIFGGHLVKDDRVTENICRVFALRHLQLNASTEAQALVPSSCHVIQNLYGTAPIMCFEKDGRMLISMPGVPFETEGMLPEVADYVHSRFAPDELRLHRSVMVAGITESALSEHLTDFEASLADGLHLAYLPTPGLIRLRLDGTGHAAGDIADRFDRAYDRLIDILGPLTIFRGDADAATIVLDTLRRRGLTLATAESCTGGNIAHLITSIAGSSDVFVGSVVSYSNDVKHRLLGVSTDYLATHGAVSQQVVEQMALGACRATGAHCAVATSGIAGPGGAVDGKPVGTVWMAWAIDGHVSSQLFHLPGNRSRVIGRASTEALLGLLKRITSLS